MSVERILLVLLAVTASIIDGSEAYQGPGQENRVVESKSEQESNREAEKKEKQREVKQGSAKEELQQERPEVVLLFTNNVRSAQPEFAADLLLRIAESTKVADPVWKRELIEEAFRLATSLQQPVKRVALPSSPIDTRAGFLASAFELRMDTLSLQCRAVNAMLQIEKRKARELLSEIAVFQLQSLACEEALVYDVSDFYTTLKKVAEVSFTQKEVKKNEPQRLVESYIGRVVSPIEIAPILDVIASLKMSRSQLELLVYAFSKQLRGVSGDDRSFTSSLYHVDRSVKNLVTQSLQQAISTDDLLKAYRTYLIRHLSAGRCADNNFVLSREAEAGVVNNFNKALRHKSEGNILEISADDIKPLKIEGLVKTHMHWQSAKASTLLKKVKKLRFGAGDKPLTVAERETLDWQDEMEGVLKNLSDWKKEDEKSEEDYFHQKCVLFRTLIQLVSKEATREHVIREYIEFLNSFDLSRGSRIEWFWQARFLLKDSPQLDGSSAAPDYVIRRSDMMTLLESTKNPILYLYAHAEKLLSGTRP